ncbi:MAG: 3-methyl-2-oxobutanoate hydroxymethyltransferase [Brevinematia bacterium]
MKSVKELVQYKERKEKISMVTCYDYSTAKILSKTNIDLVLVGDSVGMVVYGYPSTLQVSMDQMIYHTEGVSRGIQGEKLIVSDMPFLSYQTSTKDAVKNAGLLIKAGANIVKVEGGKRVIDKIKAILDADIPVMGHLGLTPQSINITGGYKLQGRNISEIERIFEDAFLLEKEGCCSIVLELIPEEVAKELTSNLKIPTIGIGAGRFCDGQVLVINDLLGYFPDFKPKHVKIYSNLSEAISYNINKFSEEVKLNLFPTQENIFQLKDDINFDEIIRKSRLI